MTPRDHALIAQEAYTAKPDIGIEDSASRAILRDTSDGLVVAFPGTDNYPCWIADLDAFPTEVAGLGRVARGFWKAWQAIESEVYTAIADRPVTFVGHSLGAAIAILAGASMTGMGKPPVAVYGFEPPRVSFDATIQTLLQPVPVHLYKNGNDVVPDLPKGFGATHPAPLIEIGTALRPWPNIPDHMLDRVLIGLA
jgi:triacylglycerol lipase